MEDSANLHCVGVGANEKKPIISDANPEFFPLLKSLHLALALIAFVAIAAGTLPVLVRELTARQLPRHPADRPSSDRQAGAEGG